MNEEEYKKIAGMIFAIIPGAEDDIKVSNEKALKILSAVHEHADGGPILTVVMLVASLLYSAMDEQDAVDKKIIATAVHALVDLNLDFDSEKMGEVYSNESLIINKIKAMENE